MPKKQTWRIDSALDELRHGEPDLLIRDESTDNHDVVAVVPLTGDPDYDAEVTQRNAMLIAAGPKMLELLDDVSAALETCLVHFRTRMPDDCYRQRSQLCDRARQLADQLYSRPEDSSDV